MSHVKPCSIHRVDCGRNVATGSVKVHPLFKIVPRTGRPSRPSLGTPLVALGDNSVCLASEFVDAGSILGQKPKVSFWTRNLERCLE